MANPFKRNKAKAPKAKAVKAPKAKNCPACSGDGLDPKDYRKLCPACDGTGKS